MTEADCVYVSSRGIMKSCDIYPPNPVSSTRRCYEYDWARMKPGSSVYIIGSSVPDFLQRAWPLITVPCVLVTGDCDQTMPIDVVTEAQFKELIESPKLLAWFSQNLVLQHPKLHPIPIGLDYHTLSEQKQHPWGPQQTPLNQEQILKAIQTREEERIPLAYANFQFSMNTRYAADRQEALQLLDPSAVVYEPKPVSRFVTWAHQHRYTHVVSPFGGGLDCHRTWEALALRTIPILHSSPLDPLFEGLPVLIVQSWSDVTKERLAIQIPIQIHPKLTLAYWTNQIRGAQVLA